MNDFNALTSFYICVNVDFVARLTIHLDDFQRQTDD